jgi:hypothetical protein
MTGLLAKTSTALAEADIVTKLNAVDSISNEHGRPWWVVRLVR